MLKKVVLVIWVLSDYFFMGVPFVFTFHFFVRGIAQCEQFDTSPSLSLIIVHLHAFAPFHIVATEYMHGIQDGGQVTPLLN